MRTAATVLTAIGGGACWYFVVAYWALTRGRWRQSAAGQHMMLLTANLGAMFAVIFAARVWPSYPGRQYVTLGLLALVVAQLVWRCVLLHRAQDRP